MKKWLTLILAIMLCLVCTAAMAECDHNDSLVPNTNGTHSHVCTLCGENMGDEECADSCDDGDSACDWCGSTAGEADNYHFDDPTCEVVDGKHVVTCGCGVVVGTYEPRAIDNGDKLFHDMGCWYCFGANGEPEFHTGLGEGTYIDEETCSFTCEDCGFTHEGSHYAAMGSGDGFHGTSCYFCGEWTWKEDCYEECYNSDGECDVCGAPVAADQVRHDYYDLTPCVVSDGKHVRTCISCKEATLELDLIYKEYDEMLHVQGCHYCVRNGLASAEQIPHTGLGSGTNNGDGTCSFTCVDCGYTHEGAHQGGYGVGLVDGVAYHGLWCMICEVCDSCGNDEDVSIVNHKETVCTVEGDYCNHACSGCGEKASFELAWMPAEAQPTGETGHMRICLECDYVGEKLPHETKYNTTLEKHTKVCTVCEWVWDAEAHTYTDDDDLDCDVCGATRTCEHDGETVCVAKDGKHDVTCARCDELLKTVELTVKYTEAGHYTECEVCAEASEVEAHTLTYTSTNDDHTATCECGYTVTEAHSYESEEAKACQVCGRDKKCNHTYWFKIWPTPTCTEGSTRTDYCDQCGKVHSTSPVPAWGHDLTTTDMGDYLLETCSRCDYENRIEKEAPAVIGEIVTDGLQVTEAAAEEAAAIQLPEDVTAAKVFAVAYIQAGQEVQPEAAMTVRIAMTAEELAAIDGLRLVLVQQDGTLVEIPYEVQEDTIVFTAQQLGVFAFIAK